MHGPHCLDSAPFCLRDCLCVCVLTVGRFVVMWFGGRQRGAGGFGWRIIKSNIFYTPFIEPYVPVCVRWVCRQRTKQTNNDAGPEGGW